MFNLKVLLSTRLYICLLVISSAVGCGSENPKEVEYWTTFLNQPKETISQQLGNLELDGVYVGSHYGDGMAKSRESRWSFEFSNKSNRVVKITRSSGSSTEATFELGHQSTISVVDDGAHDQIIFSGLVLGDSLVLSETLKNKRHGFEMSLGTLLLVNQPKAEGIERNETKESSIETLGGSAMSEDLSELKDKVLNQLASQLEANRVNPVVTPITPKTSRVAFMWYPESLTKNLFKDSEKDIGLHVHKKVFDGSASITQCEASFQSGRLDGKTIWYYPSGNLSQVQYFDNDVRVKNWQMFRDDESNTLQFSENFDDNSRVQQWYDARGNLEETRELAPAREETISKKGSSFREWHEGFQAFFSNYNIGCNVTDWLVESGEKKIQGSWDENQKFAEVLVSLSNYCLKASGDHFTWISAGLGLEIREVASTVELVKGDVFVMHNFEYSRSLNLQEKTELVSSEARMRDFMFKELYRGEPFHFTSEFQVGVGFRYTDAKGHGSLVRQILFSHDDFVRGTAK